MRIYNDIAWRWGSLCFFLSAGMAGVLLYHMLFVLSGPEINFWYVWGPWGVAGLALLLLASVALGVVGGRFFRQMRFWYVIDVAENEKYLYSQGISGKESRARILRREYRFLLVYCVFVVGGLILAVFATLEMVMLSPEFHWVHWLSLLAAYGTLGLCMVFAIIGGFTIRFFKKEPLRRARKK